MNSSKANPNREEHYRLVPKYFLLTLPICLLIYLFRNLNQSLNEKASRLLEEARDLVVRVIVFD